MRVRPWAVIAAVVIVVVTGWPAEARAAGIVTHQWMAAEAIPLVADARLTTLLRAHADQVRGGAEFPDGGYLTRAQGVPGGDYGEEAHWQRFVDAYLAQIRTHGDCPDLADPAGPCAPLVAHLFGVAAHGMGDETWDWLFEPNAPDRGEGYIPPELAGIIGPGGIETQMDVVAIVDHGRSTAPTPAPPSEADLLAAYAATGRTDITGAAIQQGDAGLDTLKALEGALAPQYIERVRANMAWTSANIVTANGGVAFTARAIAGYWDDLWARLLDAPIPTTVVATAPRDGQTDVPATGWVRTYEPGSHDDRGGAQTRIAVYLSHSLPYVADANDESVHIPRTLPAAALRLTERDTGTVVPILAGYPQIIPYDPDYGEHGAALQPATDLSPCAWYRVETTAALLDADGQPVTPMAWTFQTACAAVPASAPPPADPARPVAASPAFTG